ncbi:nuclear localization sequence-binding protein [Copidosoma floridanum]|uniref:nuclear localization sequence-binding protein n=1 Tax=Copidosoma floridanum TaxID=29053 RepID=UPI0006C93DF6|nr:nuclear localization sequence-binding protein [Copidosoma floridanum]
MAKKHVKRVLNDDEHVKVSPKKNKVKEDVSPKKKKSKLNSNKPILKIKHEKDGVKKLSKKKSLKKLKTLNVNEDLLSGSLEDRKQLLQVLQKLKKKEKLSKISDNHESKEISRKRKHQASHSESKKEQLKNVENEEISVEKKSKKNKKIQKSKDSEEPSNARSDVQESTGKPRQKNNIDSFDSPTKSKKRKHKKTSKHEEESDVLEKSDQGTKVKKDKVISTKRKSRFEDKRDERLKKRKLIRAEQGQFSSYNKLSVDEMKAKITDFQSREKLSKTALRKLRVLKKKLSVAEGTADKKEPEKRKSDVLEESIPKSKNKKLKKDKAIKKKQTKIEKDNEDHSVLSESAISSNNDTNDKDVKVVESKNKKSKKNNNQGKTNISSKKSNQLKKVVPANGIENDEEKDEKEDGEISDDENEIPNENDKVDEIRGKKKDENLKKVDKTNVCDDTTPQVKKQNENRNEESPKKRRYVLFVGNLTYDTTTVDIKKHFLTKVDMVKDVRIPLLPNTNTPRGFAYVEVENTMDYEKALSLHGTFIRGRMINVEYSLPGSKKVGKKPELVHKNKKLHAMRKAGMLAGSKKPKPFYKKQNSSSANANKVAQN